jgi:formylglycine-generating enzyme required for sulfatase activity
MSGQIFICYRRDDNPAWARSLYDRLTHRFDRKQIFRDVDGIPLGKDFVETIEKRVGECDVLLAVIGANWLNSTDGQGRRLDNPEDFVRMEIATALRRDIRVIPILVDGALMPRSTDLPDDLKRLARRNALQVGDAHFDDDCRRLVAAIEEVLEENIELRDREAKDRLETERRETEEKDRLEVERLQQEEQDRVQRENRDREKGERIAAEIRARQEKERLEDESRVQPPSVAPATSSGKSKEDEPLGESMEAYPLAPKPGEPKREKRPLPPDEAKLRLWDRIRTPRMLSCSVTLLVILIGVFSGLFFLNKPGHLPSLDTAIKDHPLVNSLGMKFVPVAGTQVLFSIWDTRVQDFEAFLKDSDYIGPRSIYSLGMDGWKERGATWKEPGFSQGPTHPVVGASWDDAKEFCKWLTQRERGSGGLPLDREYRLPTDEEWSVAVGLKNEAGSTPQEKSGNIRLNPWDIPQKRDQNWPPPAGAGNYAGEEAKDGDWPSGWPVIPGYSDGYPRTSPVGSFEANSNGLYDMGGNVCQWCEDWYNAQAHGRVLRGAAWSESFAGSLFASYRFSFPPGYRRVDFGFRCVVATVPSK